MGQCVIGLASGYQWPHVEKWVCTLRDTGYNGDIVLLSLTEYDKETIKQFQTHKVTAAIFDKNDLENMYPETRGYSLQVTRFYLINLFLKTKNYTRVLTTDTRDVLFQGNPFDYEDYPLVVSSEEMLYGDEIWNTTNYRDSLGTIEYNKKLGSVIYNAGVILGDSKQLADLCLLIGKISVSCPVRNADQAVLNFLLDLAPYSGIVCKTKNTDGWAVQLGTTKKAWITKIGDLHLMEESHYDNAYLGTQPYIEDKIIYTDSTKTKKFKIVHQWDRIKLHE